MRVTDQPATEQVDWTLQLVQSDAGTMIGWRLRCNGSWPRSVLYPTRQAAIDAWINKDINLEQIP